MKNPTLKTLDQIAQTIFDKKGVNILALDVKKISTLTDYFVIAEGMVDRHVIAIAKELKDMLAENHVRLLYSEGEKTGEWVVLDYGDIIIHLFTPELREKYALEELWNEGKIVDVKIMVNTAKP